jgi:hypothetical protein
MVGLGSLTSSAHKHKNFQLSLWAADLLRQTCSLHVQPYGVSDHICAVPIHLRGVRRTTQFNQLPLIAMKSLKRSLASDPRAANITGKVFIRSTKSGKVQKVVKEQYLRQDIPCSSKLCPKCPATAPSDAHGKGVSSKPPCILKIADMFCSLTDDSFESPGGYQSISWWPLYHARHQCSAKRYGLV